MTWTATLSSLLVGQFSRRGLPHFDRKPEPRLCYAAGVREFLNRSKEQWGLIRRAEADGNRRLAIFVHGFRGNYLGTWGKIPELLEERADADTDFAAWDYLFLGYSTRDVSTYLDIATLISTNWRRAFQGDAPHRQPYRKLALFGHSLGTLGIRQFLCAAAIHESPMLDVLHAVTLFGAPLNGSPLAPLGSVFYPIADALKPLCPQLRMLRIWSETSFGHHPWPKVRVVLGQGDWVVGSQLKDLVQWPGDSYPDDTVLNHVDLVKPNAWTNSSIMDYLRTSLRERGI